MPGWNSTKTDDSQCDAELLRNSGFRARNDLRICGVTSARSNSRGEENHEHEINIHRRGEDELPRAVPTSARYAAALIAAMLASSAALPVLSQGVELVVVDI